MGYDLRRETSPRDEAWPPEVACVINECEGFDFLDRSLPARSR